MVDSSRSSTAIGPSMLVRGNLQGDEDLTVLGRVEGSVELTRTLIVENGGIVKADVSVRNAVVSGIVVGNINATDSIEITETGRVVGDIAAPRVLIVDGARFRGMVDMGDLDTPRASEPLPARTVSRAGSSTSALAARTSSARSTVPARRQAPPPPRPTPAPAARPSPSPSPAANRPAAVSSSSSSSSASASSGKKKKAKKKVVVRKKKKKS